jgi:hypothetical protein
MWDLVKKTDILNSPELKEKQPFFIQSIFITVCLLFIYSVLEVSVRVHYRFDDYFYSVLLKVISLSPAALIFVYFTHKNSGKAQVQYLLFLLSVFSGFYTVDRVVFRNVSYSQASHISLAGTLCSYTIIQMNLKLLSLSLLFVVSGFYFFLYE